MYRLLLPILIGISIAYASCSLFEKKGKSLPDTVSYNFHVRPILSDKCFACHGPDANKREADLRLDVAEAAYAPLKESKGAYAIVKGKPEESELYKRIISDDPDYQMPTPAAHVGLLSENEIAIIKRWIEQGARYEKHWAFTPPKKSNLPDVDNKDWCKNPIDFFILDKLERNDFQPNDEADKERLLKRASFDLTGLPPSIQMMEEFVADKSANAYEKLIDKLIGLPSYGEKMSIHWLDLSRYADSYGYQDDNIRTQWPYRDWLIHAFNENLSYDKFITWQLAGDLLPNATKEQKLATAFLRNHKFTEEGGVVPEEYRVEYNIDKTKTFSKGVLGLTVECAQCHDHKFDPFSQKDYFSLYAFFNNSKEPGYEGDVSISQAAKTPFMKITKKEIDDMMSFINKKDTASMMVSVMEDNDTLRKTFILDRGVYDSPTEQQVFPAALPAVMNFDSTKYPRNRLGLAQWTIDKNNPLTARVFINQLWQSFFGKGLVKTTGDFGMQGELPSHPELLDWLAVDFIESGWDIKRMVKMFVTSATYRQSAKVSKNKIDKDPENILLARAPRSRFSAEVIRDMVLASSGLLNKEIGGPSVKPYQPKGLWESATSGRGVLNVYRQDHGDDLYRRGMYTFIKLTVPPPSMIIFDASNRDQCEVKRTNTNTPLQALVMMNDPTVLEASRVMAQQLLAENSTAEQKITKAFKLIVCRTPKAEEQKILNAYFTNQRTQFLNGKLDAAKTIQVGEFQQTQDQDVNEKAALMKTVSAIYNLEEAITKT